jgi:aminomethyltransferase
VSPEEPLRTALYDKHVAREANMGSDAGWRIPLSFTGALEEVQEVHRRAGVFDVSHVGRIRVRGDEALDLLERVCTADVVCQEDDTARLTLLCNEAGGIIDQCLVVRLETFWVLTTSPVNREKVLAHLQEQAGDLDVRVDDQTLKTTMVCLAGPAAEGILDEVLPVRVAGMSAGQVKFGSLMLARYIALRTGYLGQWAMEVILPNMFAAQAWRFITDKAGRNAVAPAGAVARDVLRIEAGRCRYGHELNETIDPFTAGLGRAVDFEHEFLGREALETLRDKPPARTRVGLVLATPSDAVSQTAVPRLGSVVSTTDLAEAGTVTSGTFSAALNRRIAMAYVAPGAAEAGTAVSVDIDGCAHPAAVVDLPFRPG